MRSYLDFEKPVAELEAKIEELRAIQAGGNGVAIGEEIVRLEAKALHALKDLYDELTPWQKTQVARHPERPHCLDYVGALITDFTPLAGDRKFAEDEAVIGGGGECCGGDGVAVGAGRSQRPEAPARAPVGKSRAG